MTTLLTKRTNACIALSAALVALTCRGAHADNYSETVHGDLSNNRLTPTPLTLTAGSNLLTATTSSGDQDYLRITIDPGFHLAHLNLISFTGTDNLAFMAVQENSIFTETPSNPDPTNMLGWTHFGTTLNQVGTDILDDLGAGADAVGFTPPLGEGVYTFWIQQLGSATTYQLDFVVQPVPAPGALALLTLPLLTNTRRRRAL